MRSARLEPGWQHPHSHPGKGRDWHRSAPVDTGSAPRGATSGAMSTPCGASRRRVGRPASGGALRCGAGLRCAMPQGVATAPSRSAAGRSPRERQDRSRPCRGRPDPDMGAPWRQRGHSPAECGGGAAGARRPGWPGRRRGVARRETRRGEAAGHPGRAPRRGPVQHGDPGVPGRRVRPRVRRAGPTGNRRPRAPPSAATGPRAYRAPRRPRIPGRRAAGARLARPPRACARHRHRKQPRPPVGGHGCPVRRSERRQNVPQVVTLLRWSQVVLRR